MSEDGPRLWLYGDVACPWSYLALARIRKLNRSIPVVVGWRPLSRGSGVPGAEATSAVLLEPTIRRTALEEDDFHLLGVPFNGRAGGFDSRNALLALEFARDLGQSTMNRTLDGLFAAHFGLRADLNDRERLLNVCGELGLDREALQMSIEDGRYEAELDRVEIEADRYGIDRIPTIIAGRSKIVGAAPMDVLESVVSQSIESD